MAPLAVGEAADERFCIERDLEQEDGACVDADRYEVEAYSGHTCNLGFALPLKILGATIAQWICLRLPS